MADWYRQTEWNDEIEAFFFEKLRRARAQRDQYIVIQALTLAESFPEVALRLVDFYFETRTDNFDDARARMAASRARFASGGYEKALDEYLEGISDKGDGQALYVGSPIQFAFLAARYMSEKHYLPALDILHGIGQPPDTAPDMVLMYNAGYALILHETGKDPNGAAAMAEKALALEEDFLAQFADVVWRLRGITRR